MTTNQNTNQNQNIKTSNSSSKNNSSTNTNHSSNTNHSMKITSQKITQIPDTKITTDTVIIDTKISPV